MKGQAYINNKDIWTTWGVSLLSGAYEELLKPCSMKEYIENKSRLEHGTRLIANSAIAKVDERALSFSIFIEGNSVSDYLLKYESFLEELCKGLIVFKVPTLKRSFKLVYTDCSKYGNYGDTKGKFTLKFREPNPKDREVL